MYTLLKIVELLTYFFVCFTFINRKVYGKKCISILMNTLLHNKTNAKCDTFQAQSLGKQLKVFSYFVAVLYSWSKTLQGGIKYAWYYAIFFFYSNFTVRITLRTVFIQHAVYSRSVAVLRNPWGSIKVYASYFKLNLCIKGCFPLIFCRGKEMGWEIYQVPCASLVVIFNLYFLKLKRLVKTVCDKL